MGELSTDKLRAYLAALPPRAQTLLMQEFERAAGGDNAAVAAFVLDELRKIARNETEAPPARTDEPMRLVFRPFEPFLTDTVTPRPGAIRRALVAQVWRWLNRDGAPAAAERLRHSLAAADKTGDTASRAIAISDFQRAAALALSAAADTSLADRRAVLARIGPTITADEAQALADLMRAREALDALALRLPAHVPSFGPTQLAAFQAALAAPALQISSLLPFVLTLAMQRLAMPWQIIRLATSAANSDNEQRVAAVPQAIAVTMAIQDLAVIAAQLREDLRRSRFEPVGAHLKMLHDSVRGIAGEIDIRPDSTWGRQLAALRVEVSRAMRGQLEALPARVRRLLRQRSLADMSAATRLDAAEIDETVALLDIAESCRTYAGELALNEVSTRIHAELLQYVGPTTDALIVALRGCGGRDAAFRGQQVEVAIAMSRVLFGDQYAARMQRSAENAMGAEAEARSA